MFLVKPKDGAQRLAYLLIVGSLISLESDPTPHNFNSISCAGVNLGVLAAKISVFRQKLVIICATRARPKLRVFAFKISVLR